MHPESEESEFVIIVQMPVDDIHTIQWFVMFSFNHPISPTASARTCSSSSTTTAARSGAATPKTCGDKTRRSDTGHWSGMRNVLYEDFAITESMGPISDRTYETVGQSDEGIMRMRRVLIKAARDHQDGAVACGLSGDIDYAGMYGRQAEYAEGGNWVDAVAGMQPHLTAKR